MLKMNYSFPDKVCFTCRRCGLCCGDTANKTRHILLLAIEAKQIGEYTNQPIKNFATNVINKMLYLYEMKKSNEGKCFFLENDQCKIYSLRPLICRFYPFDLKFIEEINSYVFDFTSECPSIGRGKTLSSRDFKALFNLAQKKLS